LVVSSHFFLGVVHLSFIIYHLAATPDSMGSITVDVNDVDFSAIHSMAFFGQQFRSRHFTFRYGLVTNNGFYYKIEFEYRGRQYPYNVIPIGSTGYPNLVTYLRNTQPPQVPDPDPLADVKVSISQLLYEGVPLTRPNVTARLGDIAEAKIHLFVVIWMFHMFDRLVESYGRDLTDFCLVVCKDAGSASTIPDFQGIMFNKLCHLIVLANFDYTHSLPPFDCRVWDKI
jgi:hypothetical protein